MDKEEKVVDNSLLLIIDPQFDFVEKTGKLFVEGADKAIENITQFLVNNIDCFKDIVITQDTHQRFHVSSQYFWDDKVKPGIVITKDDIKSSKYIPLANREEIDFQNGVYIKMKADGETAICKQGVFPKTKNHKELGKVYVFKNLFALIFYKNLI